MEDNRKKITLTTKIISAEVEFDRYITLKEGTGSSAYYELVSLNLFKGTTVNEGHYESYVLSPDKRWYNKNDNNKITESESAFNVINNHKKEAYIFYYRRIPNPITREVADLLADSYGDDGRCAVAFHVSMETNNNGKLTDSSFQIFNDYRKSFQNDLNQDIIEYVKKHEIKLNFFRVLDKNVLNSCVGNGTCGFQLDFLLHERIVEQDDSDERDYYITTPKGKPDRHITSPAMMKRFIDHMRNKVNLNKIYFKNVLRPKIVSPTIKKLKPNEYTSYENWIYERTKLCQSKKISGVTYMEELAYYKYLTVTDFIENNASKERFLNSKYNKDIDIKELKIPLWFSISMFNYCKLDHKFSIFFNTKNVSAPYLPNYMILYYSTFKNEAFYEYESEEIEKVCEDLNHGGLNESEHFFLMKTYLLTDNFHNSLRLYHLVLQFVIKYGEFDRSFNNNFRRLNAVNIKRAYDHVEDYNFVEEVVNVNKEVVSIIGSKRKIIVLDDDDDEQHLSQNNLIDQTQIQKDALEAETIKKDLTNAFLEDEHQNNVSVAMDTDVVNDALLGDQNQNSVEMDVLNAARNDFQSQNELKSQLFDLLLFTLTSENNDITRKLKRKFNKQIKEFKTKNKDKFNKNKTLDLTITNVIDLTDGNDNEEEEEEEFKV